MTFDIKEELSKLPARPGVYIMHDENDGIIYVGKAVSLRNRVRQYFQSSRGKSVKITAMVSKIRRFEYIVTDSELEALVLENNLIKEHHPKYNTMLKDDKTYPYIKVTLDEKFPRVTLVRKMKKDRGKYYGPYSNSGAVRETIDLTRKLFGIRNCDKKIPFKNGERACLFYHIGECPAPCIGKINEEDYHANVEKAIDFLGGNYKDEIEDLRQKMEEASEKLEFEKATRYRDQIRSIEAIGQRQKITGTAMDDKDVIAMARDGNDAVVQVFFVREGKLIGREHFYMSTVQDDSDPKVLESFISQYYAGTPFVPQTLMLQHDIENRELIEEWLSGIKDHKVHVVVPKKGMKEKLVEMAAENASIVLTRDRERIKREESRTTGAAEEIAKALGIDHIERMEAFDISDISGFDSVGSMVVFEKGRPKRTDYRKFKIKTVAGPDDYQCMKEVLTRRFKRGIDGARGFERLPDLIMMDGGAGQVNVALEVLGVLKIDIPVSGMVKDDFHNTRALYYKGKEVEIDRNSEGFKLVTRIQDEAHRFAIEYHRLLRTKGQVHSILDDISGIGPARRKALMRHFESLESIKAATLDELANIPSMDMRAARAVKDFFYDR